MRSWVIGRDDFYSTIGPQKQYESISDALETKRPQFIINNVIVLLLTKLVSFSFILIFRNQRRPKCKIKGFTRILGKAIVLTNVINL